MDEDELYDEFGNLIGDPFDSDAESLDESGSEQQTEDESNGEKEPATEQEEDDMIIDQDNSTALVQTQKLSDVFSNGTETILAKPYEEAIDQPVLQPFNPKKVKIDFTDNIEKNSGELSVDEINTNLPELIYSRDYMLSTMSSLPERIRNVAVVGNLNTGKTSFIDSLVLETHAPSIRQSANMKSYKPLRFMDNHKLEISRGMTIKSSPITLLLPDLDDKSYIFNLIDSPGHTNFSDETSVSLQAADGVLLVIDVVEGLLPRDKAIISEVLHYNLPLSVVINKIDRLILELKLPPVDAYYKIKYVLDSVNSFIENNEYITTYKWPAIMSPNFNNVIFAASNQQTSFTTKSFAHLYFNNKALSNVELEKFTKALWGDVYYNPDAKCFSASSEGGKFARSFVHFILEPFYKLFTYTLTADTSGKPLSKLLWDNFKVTLHKSQYKLDTQILLREVLLKVFGSSKPLVSVLSQSIPSPLEWISNKTINNGVKSNCIDGVVAQIVKLTESADSESFYSIVRVYQGTLKVGTKVKIIGENFDQDKDDYKVETVEGIYIPGGRYRIPVSEIGPGCIALVSGIDSIVANFATICDSNQLNESILNFNKLNYSEKSVYKVAIEPENPSELPRLLEGFRKINKSYLALVIKVEESGEHVLLAPGELYLDCVLHDLRLFFTDDLNIKVSDPMTKFSETCTDSSVTKIVSKTLSGKCEISIIAEPMDSRVGRAIETGKINLSQPLKTTSKILRKEYGWDALSARSVWTFGPPDLKNPSMLIDDTLDGETDKELLYSVKDFINVGFNLGINEGPLCEEPLRNTKFKILDAVLSGDSIHRNGSQIIPMTRNAVHTGFLTATPRLLEPIYKVNATCKYVAISAISKLLNKRRGEVTSSTPIPGTPLFELEGYVPVIDSVGLESDIRLQTQGQAMCLLDFDSWNLVPGDPLNKDCPLPTLKPVPYESLARDFVMKTRRRKGLSGEPSLQKYIDSELYEKLKEGGIIS